MYYNNIIWKFLFILLHCCELSLSLSLPFSLSLSLGLWGLKFLLRHSTAPIVFPILLPVASPSLLYSLEVYAYLFLIISVSLNFVYNLWLISSFVFKFFPSHWNTRNQSMVTKQWYFLIGFFKMKLFSKLLQQILPAS